MAMVMNRLEGIVYKSTPYRENGKLLNVYTKEGKITLHARGSQKLNSPYLVMSQYLTKISFLKTNYKSFYSLREAKLVNEYLNIKSDYHLMKSVSLMLELINRVLIDDNYHSKVYNILNDSLNSPYLEEASLSFSLKLLYFLGVGPNLEASNRDVIGFNIRSGNLVYQGDNLTLDLNYTETLNLLKLTYPKITNLEKLTKDEIEVIKRFVYYYYIDKLDLKLKSLE